MNYEMYLQLIEQSGVVGFDYNNDDIDVTWKVTPGADKMLALKAVEYDDGAYGEKLFTANYASLDEVDELYDMIVNDFVDFYRDDLRDRNAARWNLFSDIASPRDEGLLELLSFFGKTYDEFLIDVFYWFADSLDVDDFECECDDDEWGDDEDGVSEDDRVVIKVLDRLGKYELDIQNEESGIGYFWSFAKANGEIWYSVTTYSYGEYGYYVDDTQYGHHSLCDGKEMFALRSIIFAQLELSNWKFEDTNSSLGLLGIDVPK